MSSARLRKLTITGMSDNGEVTEPTLPIGLRAQVPGHQKYESGDKLKVFWNETLVFEHQIQGVEVENGVLFQIEKRFIEPGDAKAYYTVTQGNGNSVKSEVLNLKVNPAT